MLTVVCAGDITVTGSYPTCSVPWSVVETGLGFDLSQLDPVAICSAFTAGAVVCFVPLAIAWAVAFVLSSIRGY